MSNDVSAALRRRLPLDETTAHEDVAIVAEQLVRALPGPAGRAIARAADLKADADIPESASPDTLETDVLDRLSHPPHQARAVFRTVLALLAERLDEGPRELVAKHLPSSLADLARDPGLVEGEPSARDGDSDVAPQPSDLDRRRAHDHSVVNASNPHADRKLSSGRDTPKVRGEILSEGRAQGAGSASEFIPDYTEDDDDSHSS